MLMLIVSLSILGISVMIVIVAKRRLRKYADALIWTINAMPDKEKRDVWAGEARLVSLTEIIPDLKNLTARGKRFARLHGRYLLQKQ